MKTYKMNDKTYTKLTAIADELGLSRIRPAQFAKYGIMVIEDTADTTTPVDITPAADEAPVVDTQDTQDTPAQDDTVDPCDGCDYPCKDGDPCPHDADAKNDTADTPADDAADKKDEPTDQPKKKQTKAKKEAAPKQPTLAETITAEGKVAEDISTTVSLEDFSKALKKVSLETLDKVAEAANIDLTDTRAASNGVAHTLPDPIRRMHLTIILREHFYPGQKLEAKKSSQFRKVDLAVLTAKADAMGLTYTKRDNDAITRMWVTKALVDAGVTYDDVVPPQDDTQVDDTTPADTAADNGDQAVSA